MLVQYISYYKVQHVKNVVFFKVHVCIKLVITTYGQRQKTAT